MAQDLTPKQIGDILSIITNKQQSMDNMQQSLNDNAEMLGRINRNLELMMRNMLNMSASNARVQAGDDASTFFRARSASRSSSGRFVSDIFRGVDSKRIAQNLTDDVRRNLADKADEVITSFLDGMEEEIKNGFGLSGFDKKIKGIMDKLAEQMGVSTDKVKATLGRELGRRFLQIPDVKAVADWAKSAQDAAFGKLTGRFMKGFTDAGGISRSAAKTIEKSSEVNLMTKAVSTGSADIVRAIQEKDVFADLNKGYIGRPGMEVDPDIVRKYKDTASIPAAPEMPSLELDPGLKDVIDAKNQKAAFDSISGMAKEFRSLISGKISNIPILGGMQDITKSIGDSIKGALGRDYNLGKSNYLEQIKLGESGDLGKVGKAIQALTGGNEEAGAALAGVAKAATSMGSTLFLANIALKHVSGTIKKDLIPALKEYTATLIETATKNTAQREKKLDEANKRLRADVETMVKTPFELLSKGAQEWYDAWDQNLRTISATQGYTKADMQNLLATFAERLREENLTSVIAATDLTENLSKVLQSGLSGQVAEEFAFIATKLNAAVPTQDFFSYADTYASIAANAISAGKSQEYAIQLANRQMEQFASNVLYASRELSGGFTTGLKDAGDLFKKSVQIAQTGRVSDIGEISGVLSSVAAITGAVAPDLAQGIIDAVYKASVGGNATDLVALRSLSGVNASNTEFLRQLVNNPKDIFSEMFKTLAGMQSMSPDAYMEVAEGLSSVFGVSMDSLARVDFRYLAQAIDSMNVNSRSLDENIALLVSGATTTETEQLKMQQINKMILDEGLSYVLDNEAARAIQQHMWDEQIAMKITESEFAVNLTGASAKLLEKIAKTTDNIFGIINPFKWGSWVANLSTTSDDIDNMEKDIKQMLELGKVGSGNSAELYNLTTRGVDLSITDPLVKMMGGAASYTGYHPVGDAFDVFGNPFRALLDEAKGSKQFESDTNKFFKDYYAQYSTGADRARSQYTWGTIGKSISKAISDSYKPAAYGPQPFEGKSNTELAQDQMNAKLQKILDGMETTIGTDAESIIGYEDWMREMSQQYSISNLTQAMENAGISDEALRGQYDAVISKIYSTQETNRKHTEEKFWSETSSGIVDANVSLAYANDRMDYTAASLDSMKGQNDQVITSLLTVNNWMDRMYSKTSDIYLQIVSFYDQWVDYFIKHTVYSKSYDHSQVSAIQRAEKKGSEDAVYALADALTKNQVDLLDPTMQTNALLAEILKVANALLNKGGAAGGGLSLPDTIAGLSLGVVQRV